MSNENGFKICNTLKVGVVYVFSLIALMCSTMWVMPLDAQERSGWITGSVADSGGGILPGARVELQPAKSETRTLLGFPN